MRLLLRLRHDVLRWPDDVARVEWPTSRSVTECATRHDVFTKSMRDQATEMLRYMTPGARVHGAVLYDVLGMEVPVAPTKWDDPVTFCRRMHMLDVRHVANAEHVKRASVLILLRCLVRAANESLNDAHLEGFFVVVRVLEPRPTQAALLARRIPPASVQRHRTCAESTELRLYLDLAAAGTSDVFRSIRDFLTHTREGEALLAAADLSRSDVHVDHYVPAVSGGPTTLANAHLLPSKVNESFGGSFTREKVLYCGRWQFEAAAAHMDPATRAEFASVFESPPPDTDVSPRTLP